MQVVQEKHPHRICKNLDRIRKNQTGSQKMTICATGPVESWRPLDRELREWGGW